MKVYFTILDETDSPWLPLLQDRAARSKRHEVVSDPVCADLILLFGIFALEPQRLLGHQLFKSFPEKCAVYTEEDSYLPLVPGVYCSAQKDENTHSGRVFSYTYLSRNGRHHNSFLAELPTATPISAVSVKRYLFSFQGGSTSLVRKRLFNLNFNRDDILIENTSAYSHWDESQPNRRKRQLRYAETIAASHFVLCPRGAGAGTIRFFEVMANGVAPILISDSYELPVGPDWDKFLIRVPEGEIASLPKILEQFSSSSAERGCLARNTFLKHFSVEQEFDHIVDLSARAIQHGGRPEVEFRKRQPAMIRSAKTKRRLRTAFRWAALESLKVLRLRNPYQMNR